MPKKISFPPNYTGSANKISLDDSRQKKWQKQRKKRGFDDTELWVLDIALCKWLVPRLAKFKKHNIGFPDKITSKKWNKILQKMIDGFSDGDFDKRHKAFKLLKKYHNSLWY